MPARSPVPATAPDSPEADDRVSQIREAWAAALEHRNFTDDDDFFVVGGHSVLAARVMARLGRELGRRLRMRIFFDNPTVAELAAAVSAHVTEQPGKDHA
jgi:Phosphopantetheine attachment site